MPELETQFRSFEEAIAAIRMELSGLKPEAKFSADRVFDFAIEAVKLQKAPQELQQQTLDSQKPNSISDINKYRTSMMQEYESSGTESERVQILENIKRFTERYIGILDRTSDINKKGL